MRESLLTQPRRISPFDRPSICLHRVLILVWTFLGWVSTVAQIGLIMLSAVDKTIWTLFFVGIVATTFFLHFRQFHDSLSNEIAVHHTKRVLSETEQAVRRRALEHLHNISMQRQEEIHKEDKTIIQKIHSDEFFFLDSGTRYKIQNEWDYDYWLADNSSDYYEYYLTDALHSATVIGITNNASFDAVRLFVYTLRRTGYAGRIAVLIDERSDKNTLNYLKNHGVDIKYVKGTKCTHNWPISQRRCLEPYPNIISEWGHIPIVRDYLLDCYQRNECTDAVLLVDISKTFFQRDPFGPGARFMQKLELFEENPHFDVKTSIVRERILSCTGLDIRNRPLISADSVAGPVSMVISFLDHVYDIMRAWMSDPKCHSQYHSDDDLKAIFNFIRLNNSVPVNVTYFSHRTSIVNNVGYDGKRILQSHIHFQQFRGFSIKEAMAIPFEGSNGSRWIGNDYLLIDDEGYFVNLDFQRSFIVQQYDTFGPPFMKHLYRIHNISSSSTYS